MRRLPIATAVCCGLVAACGSSGKPSTAGGDSNSPLAFARCMRAHGVPDFPDPSSNGPIAINAGTARSPVFQAAQKACGNFTKGFGAPAHMTASDRQAAVRFANCMRANGQPDFPDPTQSPPSGATRVLVLRGMAFVLGLGIDPKSPAFRQAATRCGIRPPGGSPRPG